MRFRLTSFGLPRSNHGLSQDAFLVKSWQETVIAVLADGVGASVCGREAATRLVETFVSNYQTRPLSWSTEKALREFTKILNRTLHEESRLRYGAPEMLATLCVAVVEGDQLTGLNIGDSPLYWERAGTLQQLSRDHTDPGMPHMLVHAVGLRPEVEPHVFSVTLQDGDTLLLCSDGLSRVMNPEKISEKLRGQATAQTLVTEARALATTETLDDISAIVIAVIEVGKLRAASRLPLPIPDLLQKGRIMDGYELIRPSQHSDRAWLAAKNDQRWMMKFPPHEAKENEPLLEQFILESWNATRLHADFFVNAFVPENATARYYVMPFIEAPSLRSLLKSRPLAIDEAIALGRFLLQVAQHLLRLDLVHGDIKPENILVITDYDRLSFKLIDFGSVSEIFSVTSRAGTASYLAPERFHEAPITERTEIFAIGVTLYESLTGTLPYGEIERFQTPGFLTVKNPTHLNPNIPLWLESVLLRALSRDPSRRYRHYSEFAFDLGHPTKVEPFRAHAGSLQITPLQFYRTAFFILLFLVLILFWKLFQPNQGTK